MKVSQEVLEHIDYVLRLAEGKEKTIGEKLAMLDYQIMTKAQTPISGEPKKVSEPVFTFVK